ncbi:hypothetical protein COOONC_25525 [Cooperia oncophora]
MKSFTHRLVRVLFRIAALCSLVASYEVRSVNTAWGVVRGELVHPDGADLAPVTQFLGVPYGVAPSGQFRFNMAISAAKWTHLPKEARKLAPACIQTQLPELSETRAFKQMSAQRFDYVHRLLPKLKLQSEDCLYMNLFVPERLDRGIKEEKISEKNIREKKFAAALFGKIIMFRRSNHTSGQILDQM